MEIEIIKINLNALDLAALSMKNTAGYQIESKGLNLVLSLDLKCNPRDILCLKGSIRELNNWLDELEKQKGVRI